MTVKEIAYDEAIATGETLDFIFLRSLSFLFVGKCVDYVKEHGAIADIAKDEIVELSFFDKKMEVRATNEKAVLLCDEGTDEKDKIIKLFPVKNSKDMMLEMTYFLDYDEDGQIYIKASKKSDWRECGE